MPGTNLTRDEARTRASLLSVDTYDVELDLTTGPDTFGSVTTVRFSATEEGLGASTWIDLVGAEVEAATLNGEPLDPGSHTDGRLPLPELQADNELVVRARCRYSRTGEGLHRFVDPADDKVYLYTQFEVPDARRVYACFEQPDLKAVFTFTVTAPDHWLVVSNSPRVEPEPAGEGAGTWRFAPTERMSTYITALVAGEYVEVRDSYAGRGGEIPLGLYCRASKQPDLDVDRLLQVTKQGFAFFEEAFDSAYPFGTYDQLFVPEYNMGAMENAGCVTFRDEYLPRSRQTAAFYESRANTILHEMAHMWFGDLVTMRWWDDLWLNESFAEWASHWAMANATEYTEAWTSFATARKVWAYRQDQLPSTHPVAADNHDLHAVEVNFDGITYAKGASALKQLVAWVGEEEFVRGLRAYFAEHAFGNTDLEDLLSQLEAASGRELRPWVAEWLQTSGVNTLRPEVTVTDDGRMAEVAVAQTAIEAYPTLRRHRIGVGLYDLTDGRLALRRRVETDVRGERTVVEELAGELEPDLLLLNDGDLTYAKIRLGERSLRTVVQNLASLEDSLARSLCWGAAWDMTRDAEMRARDYVDLVVRALGSESDVTALGRVPMYARQAVERFTAPADRDALRRRWEAGVRGLLRDAEPGSDHQLAFVRAYAAASVTDEALDHLEQLLAGEASLDGLEIDTDLRWTLLSALAAAGRAGAEEIAAERDRDATISGQERAAAALAVRPTVEAKQEAWRDAVERDDVANETQRSVATAFTGGRNPAALEPFVEQYLTAAESIWESKGTQRASTVLEYMFPVPLASDGLIDRVDRWLEETAAPEAAKRYVREGRDEAARALRAQASDAQDA
ncbi:aminopeptidase N [Nocardioidaceae bacterium]|nr:aminopeptidase N [Nocardioidaceae bacterium]